jgi:hypothetical protein
VLETLSWSPGLLVLHDGPNLAKRGLLGSRLVREVLEAAPPGKPGLVVRATATGRSRSSSWTAGARC